MFTAVEVTVYVPGSPFAVAWLAVGLVYLVVAMVVPGAAYNFRSGVVRCIKNDPAVYKVLVPVMCVVAVVVAWPWVMWKGRQYRKSTALLDAAIRDALLAQPNKK